MSCDKRLDKTDEADYVGDPNVAAFEEDLCRPACIEENQGHRGEALEKRVECM
jgi:hypothetical protein